MGPQNSDPVFSAELLKGMELEKGLERIQRLLWKSFPSVSSGIQEFPIPRTFGSIQPNPVWDSWAHLEQIPWNYCSQERKNPRRLRS